MKHSITSFYIAALVAIAGAVTLGAGAPAVVQQPVVVAPPVTNNQTAPKVSTPTKATELQPSNVAPSVSQPVATVAPTVGRYYVYDVGPVVLTGNNGLFRLNQNGQMIWNTNGHTYLYQSCQSRDLGSLGGGQSVAFGISNNGVVVGKSTQASGRWRAFSYANGVMRDLGGSADKLINESATAINYWGDIVGVESVSGGLAPTGVRYQSGTASKMARILLNPPAGWAQIDNVVDLNDSKYVLGSISNSGSLLAFLSTNFGSLWTKIAGVSGFENATTPRAMNRYGHVAGVAGNGFVRAFVSRDPNVPATDLGTLGGQLSMANGINNYGWVVGWAEQTNGGGPRAFIHDGAHMFDLNTVLWNGGGWLLREAMAVNDAGLMAGEGYLNGQAHAFLLQPMAREPLANPCRPTALAQ